MKMVTNIILWVSAALFTACNIPSDKNILTSDEFEMKMKEVKEYVLIDVRTPAEYAEGHINGAVNTDYNGGELTAYLQQCDKNKTYLVYCKSGKRSAAAAEAMRKAGVATVYELEGGYLNWIKAGKSHE